MSFARMKGLRLLGLASAVALGTFAQADEPKKPPVESSQPKQEANHKESVEQVDKLLKTFSQYRERAAEKSDVARKDIEAMIKDLNDLTEQRYNMTLMSMTLRARQAGESPNELPVREAMSRELRQLQAQLRSEIEQEQNRVNQAAMQLESIRRQLTQPKSEQTHNTTKGGAEPKEVTRGGDPG